MAEFAPEVVHLFCELSTDQADPPWMKRHHSAFPWAFSPEPAPGQSPGPRPGIRPGGT
jgi:hypothetical protein